ncbi:MAG: hypothetical protein AB9842_04035 [Bacteroidales bacterium]
MKKWIIISLALLVSLPFLCAQVIEEFPINRPANNINLNTLGANLTIISINYERLFLKKSGSFLSASMGVGYNQEVDIFEPGYKPSYLTFPLHITMNLGKRKKFFEVGMGGTVFFGDELPDNRNEVVQHFFWYPIVGYRLQPLQSNRLNFRVYGSFPPSFILNDWETFTFWWFPVGVSLGITLNNNAR